MNEIFYDKSPEEIREAVDGVLDSMSSEEKKLLVAELNYELRMELPNGNVINFNTEQYQGIIKLRKWLKSDRKFFVLSGFAGTGKTTIVKRIIDEQGRRSIVVSAPTHKAKKVIMRTTGQDGETLQALLGLRPDVDLDDFNPNDPKFSPISKPKMEKYSFIIIDEASMVNEDLFLMIKKEASYHKRVKILFMGDSAQTPPVHEKLSIVFTEESGIKDMHHLTQVMRQEDGNPLALVYDKLRNNLRDPYGGIDRVTALNSKGEGITFTRNNHEFREKLKGFFISPEFRNDLDYVRLIAWRNTTVIESNMIIREFIFGEDAHMLMVHDVLMAYRSVRNPRQYMNMIDNSADYKVMNVSDREMNEHQMWGYRVSLRETLVNGKYRYQKVFILDHHDHDNLHDYAEMHDFLKERALPNKKLWKDYYTFRRDTLIMVTIDEFRDMSTRFYTEKIVKDFDYGYAITGHKSQGSTYQHVLVLENDIDLNPTIKERNQIKYVALTRPAKTATVFTRLAE